MVTENYFHAWLRLPSAGMLCSAVLCCTRLQLLSPAHYLCIWSVRCGLSLGGADGSWLICIALSRTVDLPDHEWDLLDPHNLFLEVLICSVCVCARVRALVFVTVYTNFTDRCNVSGQSCVHANGADYYFFFFFFFIFFCFGWTSLLCTRAQLSVPTSSLKWFPLTTGVTSP